jgi:hypothetical protein
MENVGAECYERGEGGVCWWEGDLETQDCGGVGSFGVLASELPNSLDWDKDLSVRILRRTTAWDRPV